MIAPLPQLSRTLAAALRDARDARAEVRADAVRDLAVHAAEAADPRPREALLAALARDPSGAVRAAAAVGLADAGLGDVSAALLGALEDPELRVRTYAVLALGEVGDPALPGVAAALVPLLAHDAPALRFQALIAVTTLGIAQGEAVALAALSDPDAEVRHLALRLLEEPLLAGGDAPCLSARAAERAAGALDDRDPRVRGAAAVLLARARDPRGRGVLHALCAGLLRGASAEDEQAAVELAGELGEPAAAAFLGRRAFPLFGSPPLQRAARIALARLGDPRARAVLLRGLSAFGRDARTQAVDAVARAGLVEAVPRLEALAGRPRAADPEVVEEALASLRGRAGASSAGD